MSAHFVFNWPARGKIGNPFSFCFQHEEEANSPGGEVGGVSGGGGGERSQPSCFRAAVLFQIRETCIRHSQLSKPILKTNFRSHLARSLSKERAKRS